MEEFFNDPESSDLVVVSKHDGKEERFHVSKLVLKVKSPVFKKALSGNWQESQANEITVNFPEDVVKAMLLHFYGVDYTLTTQISDIYQQSSLFHAQVFAIADYYEVQDLLGPARKSTRALLRADPRVNEVIQSEDFHATIQYAYTEIPDIAAKPLRDTLIKCALNGMEKNIKNTDVWMPSFTHIVNNYAAFAHDLMLMLCGRVDISESSYTEIAAAPIQARRQNLPPGARVFMPNA